jgi:hypothetical protein
MPLSCFEFKNGGYGRSPRSLKEKKPVALTTR